MKRDANYYKLFEELSEQPLITTIRSLKSRISWAIPRSTSYKHFVYLMKSAYRIKVERRDKNHEILFYLPGMTIPIDGDTIGNNFTLRSIDYKLFMVNHPDFSDVLINLSQENYNKRSK